MANIPQTTVDDTQGTGIEGQLADMQSTADAIVDTGINDDTTDIAFGRFVMEGTESDDGVLNVAAALGSAPAKLAGISVHGHSFERLTELNADGITPTTTFGRLVRGRVFMIANTDVTKDSEVHVCYATNSGYVIGRAGAAAVSTKTIDISAYARWIVPSSGGTKGDIVILEIDLTNRALGTADT